MMTCNSTLTMVTKKQIQDFLEPKKLAIAGVSRDSKKFGYMVYRDLKKNGYEVYPVNPKAPEIDGSKCYPSVSDLPGDVNRLLILTPRKDTDDVLREAIGKGIRSVWVQQMSETPDTVRIADENQVDLIQKKCIYMFADPVVSIHKFHRTLVKFFGRLPR